MRKHLGSSHAIDPYAHGYWRFWPVMGIAGHLGNFFRDILALDNFAKNGVLIVQPGCWRNSDKELAAVGVRSGVGHREPARLGVLERRVEFVSERIARSTHARAMGTTTLDHKLRNDAMENQVIIKGTLFLFPAFFVGEFSCTFSKADKVLYRFGRFSIE